MPKDAGKDSGERLEASIWREIIKQIESIVPIYERAGRATSLFLADKVRREAIRASLIIARRCRVVVDVGCGPGTSIDEILRVVNPSYLVCVDPSAFLLKYCRQRFQAKYASLDLVIGVAEYMPIRTEATDMATVFYAARDFSNPLKGLSEMVRVSRCTIAIGDVFLPDTKLARVLVKTWVSHFAPAIVNIIAFGQGRNYRGLSFSLNGWYSLRIIGKILLKQGKVKTVITRGYALGGIGYAVAIKDSCRLKWS